MAVASVSRVGTVREMCSDGKATPRVVSALLGEAAVTKWGLIPAHAHSFIRQWGGASVILLTIRIHFLKRDSLTHSTTNTTSGQVPPTPFLAGSGVP